MGVVVRNTNAICSPHSPVKQLLGIVTPSRVIYLHLQHPLRTHQCLKGRTTHNTLQNKFSKQRTTSCARVLTSLYNGTTQDTADSLATESQTLPHAQQSTRRGYLDVYSTPGGVGSCSRIAEDAQVVQQLKSFGDGGDMHAQGVGPLPQTV